MLDKGITLQVLKKIKKKGDTNFRASEINNASALMRIHKAEVIERVSPGLYHVASGVTDPVKAYYDRKRSRGPAKKSEPPLTPRKNLPTELPHSFIVPWNYKKKLWLAKVGERAVLGSLVFLAEVGVEVDNG